MIFLEKKIRQSGSRTSEDDAQLNKFKALKSAFDEQTHQQFIKTEFGTNVSSNKKFINGAQFSARPPMPLLPNASGSPATPIPPASAKNGIYITVDSLKSQSPYKAYRPSALAARQEQLYVNVPTAGEAGNQYGNIYNTLTRTPGPSEEPVYGNVLKSGAAQGEPLYGNVPAAQGESEYTYYRPKGQEPVYKNVPIVIPADAQSGYSSLVMKNGRGYRKSTTASSPSDYNRLQRQPSHYTNLTRRPSHYTNLRIQPSHYNHLTRQSSQSLPQRTPSKSLSGNNQPGAPPVPLPRQQPRPQSNTHTHHDNYTHLPHLLHTSHHL